MNQRQFTTAVQDVLRNLEKTFSNQGMASVSGPYIKENIFPRIDNVMFRQGDEWVGRQKNLAPLEELELVDELGMYLQEQKHEYVRYRIFDAIFSMARDEALEYRTKETNNDALETTSEKCSWPCWELLDVVQHWLLQDSTICYCTATQMDKLWRTVVKATQTIPDSLSLTPLDGLAGWCVKTPFAPELVTSSLSTSGRNNSDTLSYTQLHSRLHYGYLKSLLASKPALKAIAKGSVLGNPDLQLWTKQQVHSLIGELMALCNHSDTTPIQGSTDELAIDRFSQICQIAIATRILSCTRDQFQSLSDPLPKTRLLEIIAYGPDRTPPMDETPMEIMTY